MNLVRALRAGIGHFGPRAGPDRTWRLTIIHDDGSYQFTLDALDGTPIAACTVTSDGRVVAS